MGSKTAVIGAVFLLVVTAVALWPDLFSPGDPRAQAILYRLRSPSADFPLGTDQFGRDILSRIIHGTRVSMAVGLLSVLIGGTAGTLLGVAAGYVGGRFDRAVMALSDVLMAFPQIVLGLLVVVIIGPGLTGVTAAIAVSMLPRFIRLARAPTLTIRELPYVEAGRAIGMSHFRLIAVHIVPNLMGQIVVMKTLWMATAIRIEASLSFLGLGIQPPLPTWGNMISDGMSVLFTAPWLAIFPGLAIMLTVLAFNMVGDGLRDALDPRTRAHGSKS